MVNKNKIKELIQDLPTSDIPHAWRFIEKRDFLSLKELIDSAIFKIKKELASNNPSLMSNSIDLHKIYNLKGIIDCYYMQIEGEEQIEEINETENEEEYFRY